MKNSGKLTAIASESVVFPALRGVAAAEALRFEAHHQFTVAAPIGRVFALFTPDGESDWEPGWSPIPVVPGTIRAENNAVFYTQGHGRKVIWTMLNFDPEKHRVEYLVVDPEYQQRWITVQCASLSDQTSSVSVTYVSTALSEEGARNIQHYDEDFMREWEQPVRKAAIDASL